MTKLRLDLHYVMTNSYTKFYVNLSKDSREKSGKLKCDVRTDGQSDGQTDSEQTNSPQVSRKGTNKHIIQSTSFEPLHLKSITIFD